MVDVAGGLALDSSLVNIVELQKLARLNVLVDPTVFQRVSDDVEISNQRVTHLRVQSRVSYVIGVLENCILHVVKVNVRLHHIGLRLNIVDEALQVAGAVGLANIDFK